MKRILPFLFCTSLLSASAFSQDEVVPANYSFQTKDDYVRYEKQIIAAADWLLATPLNEQADKRKTISAFVLQWVSGSPTVSVEINPAIMDFEKKNEGMLMLYMAASARYALQNNYSTDMRAKQKAALQAMAAVYKTGTGIRKDKKMDKLQQAIDKGELDAWLAENLKIEGH